MEMDLNGKQVLLALSAGCAVKNALFWLLRNKDVREYVGRVSGISVYPLKSGRSLQDVTSASLTKYGMLKNAVFDRHWIVTYKGTMQNLTLHNRLTLVSTMEDGDSLRLDAPDMPPLRLPVNPKIDEKQLVTIKIAFAAQTALDCGDAPAAWISKFLGKEGLRLNYSAPELPKRRTVDVRKDWPIDAKDDEHLGFQDLVQCMIVNETSVDELNKRLPKPVLIGQFRPNLTIRAEKPFDEDTWKYVYIGETARVRFVDNCTRCPITTIDINTAEKDKGQQPLVELKKFRCKEKYGPQRPVMGIHTNCEVEGDVHIGDKVYVVRK